MRLPDSHWRGDDDWPRNTNVTTQPSAFKVEMAQSKSEHLVNVRGPLLSLSPPMKTVLGLAVLASLARAIVIPDQSTLNALALEDPAPAEHRSHPFWNVVESAEKFWELLEEKFTTAVDNVEDKLEHFGDEFEDEVHNVIDYSYETAVEYGKGMHAAFAPNDWMRSLPMVLPTANHRAMGLLPMNLVTIIRQEMVPMMVLMMDGPPRGGPPRDGPPRDGPPSHGPPNHGPPRDGPSHGGPPHREPRHKRPRQPPQHGKPNETVYELISKNKHTSRLAAAINEFPDLVELLNGTKANYTLFAPTNEAFEKIPKRAPKPPKEFLKKLLTYHVSPDFYPVGRVFSSRTIPTALDAEFLSTKDHKVQQRLSTQIAFKGLTVNFYSHIVAVDIFGINGVIHAIDSILLPPPKAVRIIGALPGEFSTLELALTKTGLIEHLSDASSHVGGTLFAPSNFAFQKLGPRINAFLFSPYGQKYLKALLLYHVAPNVTLYSDAIYKSSDADSEQNRPHGPPRGIFHVDLPTALPHRSLSIDIARFGRLISLKINGFNKVVVSDGVAADGVIHVVPNVLIPPKQLGGDDATDEDGIDLDEFTERLAPYVDDAAEDPFAPEL
ncbi:hypothetical protein DV738_g912, partial [Chaetothyriales sp. CBS 135597]